MEQEITNEGLAIHLKYIRDELAAIKQTLEDFKSNYVTKEEFALVKSLVYGFAGIILTAVILSLVYLVVKK